MSDLTLIEDDADFQPPSYSEPGRMLVEIEAIHRGHRPIYRYSATLHDYTGSVFWINEGVGIEHWLDDHVQIEEEGWYVFEGVIGSYIRGDGWMTDDDEVWDFALCRRASPAEIEAQCLGGSDV